MGSSGIASNGSAYNNIAARSGTQCAFIQGTGAVRAVFRGREGGHLRRLVLGLAALVAHRVTRFRRDP